MTYNEYPGSDDDLIKEFIPYAFRIAISLNYLSPNNLDGLKGEALLALCESINTMKEKPDVEIVGIIITSIRRYLYEYSVHCSDIRIPRRSYTALSNSCRRTMNTDIFKLRASMPQRQCLCEVNELIEDMKLTNEQRILLSLMLQGYSRAELAEMYSCSCSRMTQLKREIKEKYHENKQKTRDP